MIIFGKNYEVFRIWTLTPQIAKEWLSIWLFFWIATKVGWLKVDLFFSWFLNSKDPTAMNILTENNISYIHQLLVWSNDLTRHDVEEKFILFETTNFYSRFSKNNFKFLSRKPSRVMRHNLCRTQQLWNYFLKSAF